MSYLIFINAQQINTKPIDFARTLQVNDIANLTNRNSNYTGTIKILRTATNKIIFDNAFNSGSDSNIPYQKATCDIIDADTGQHVVYKGWAVLLESTPNEYSINITDGSIDFYKAIENKTISEIGISELNHLKIVENVIDTWTDLSLPYRYILADYNGNNDASGNVNIDYQVPSASASYLWNKIFEFIGWEYSGAIFQHEKFTNLWMTYPKPTPLEAPVVALVTFQASQFQGNIVYYGDFQGYITSLNFLPILSAINPVFYSVNGGAVNAGIYRFKFDDATFQLQSAGLPTVYSSRVKIVIYDALNQVVSEDFVIISQDNSVNVYMNEGDKFYISLVYQDSDNEFTGGFTPNAITVLSGAQTLTKVELISGQSVGFEEAFINYKITDFVREIMIRFALTPFKDKYTNKMYFLTMTEYLQNQNIDNYTSKFSRKLSEKYVFGGYAKNNLFKYKYNQTESIHYDGAFTISNENLPEKKTIFSSQIYAPELLRSYFLGSSNIYKIWDKEIKDDNAVEYKGLDNRFYFMRARLVNNFITLGSNVLGGTQTSNKYYRESYYRLSYDDILEDFYRPMKSIFNKAKIILADMWLKPIDIVNLNFSKLIFIEQLSSYYLLNKVSNFVKNKATKVELIEVDYFTETEIVNPTPVDFFVYITDAVVSACQLVLTIDTNYALPVDCELVIYAGSLDALSNPEDNEIQILPIQVQTLTATTLTYSITNLQYNSLGYRFAVKILNENIFENIYSTPTDTMAIDGSCYAPPVLTNITITNVVFVSETASTKTYDLTFTSDVVLPVTVMVQSFRGGVWSNYAPINASSNTIPVVVGTIFGTPTKFRIKIGAIESLEYIL